MKRPETVEELASQMLIERDTDPVIDDIYWRQALRHARVAWPFINRNGSNEAPTRHTYVDQAGYEHPNEIADILDDHPSPTPPSETCQTCGDALQPGTFILRDVVYDCLDPFHTKPPSEDEERLEFRRVVERYSALLAAYMAGATAEWMAQPLVREAYRVDRCLVSECCCGDYRIDKTIERAFILHVGGPSDRHNHGDMR